MPCDGLFLLLPRQVTADQLVLTVPAGGSSSVIMDVSTTSAFTGTLIKGANSGAGGAGLMILKTAGATMFEVRRCRTQAADGC